MKQNIWVVTVGLVAAAVGMALGASCTPETECDYIDRDVGDPLHPTEDDITYCWQGLNPTGLYTLRLEPGSGDGGTGPLYFVQPPNSLEPAGAELLTTWQLIPDFPTTAGPVAALSSSLLGGSAQVEVNRTTMILGSTPADSVALRRAVCSGFGYETPQKQCRGSASRP